MNCKTVQELILTDYSDGQLAPRRRQQVEGHVQGCPACRMLAQRVRKESVAPFERLPKAVPDEFAWLRLKREIERQQSLSQAPVKRFDIVTGFIFSLRSWAIAASIAAMLAVVPLLYFNSLQKQSYLAYVMETDTPSNEVTSGIEQYFL